MLLKRQTLLFLSEFSSLSFCHFHSRLPSSFPLKRWKAQIHGFVCCFVCALLCVLCVLCVVCVCVGFLCFVCERACAWGGVVVEEEEGEEEELGEHWL